MLIALLACAVLTLLLQFNIFSNNKLTKDYEDIRRLLAREREQYQQAKENIELINLKCHDIKHQIAAMRTESADAFAREAESIVNIYENTARTGNEALDIILTEKGLYCTQNDIQLTYIADGSKLNFMKPTDTYSLFGNALSNAIECVATEPDAEKRLISLDVHAKDHLLLVSIENYTPSDEVFQNLIPATRKDRNYHGYGLKSIRYITEQYGGKMSIVQKNHYFSLSIVFPL